MNSKILLVAFIIIWNLFNVIPSYSQTENKVAVLTVSGSGKTQEEAKQNALRNAIEQAFGAFISSNTQILNDELLKDEIVSVSSGNIQEYMVISEVQTPDGNWSNTVKAKVAVDKLTSFCKNKGLNVEFKGSLFSLNIKQQALNDQNELTVIENAVKVVHEIFDKSFDFEVQAGEPIQSVNPSKASAQRGNAGIAWKIALFISVKVNNNISIASDYLYKTLDGLSLTASEIENYTNLNKSVTPFAFEAFGYQNSSQIDKKIKKNKKNTESPTALSNVFYLRNENSLYCIIDCINYIKHSVTFFTLKNDIESLTGEMLFKWENVIDGNYPRFITTKMGKFSFLSEQGNQKLASVVNIIVNFKPIYYDQEFLTFFADKVDDCRDVELYYRDNNPIFLQGRGRSEFYTQRSRDWCAVKAGSVSKQRDYYFRPDREDDLRRFNFINSLNIAPTGSNGNKYQSLKAIISLASIKVGDLIALIAYNDYKKLDQLSKISGYSISANK
ncbi:MAG: hypothetical protein WCK18_10010 [Prolixibacteraceae bacterium]